MELRPHLFLEGVLIAMRFAEAEHGWIYLREEYATARERLARAIEELRAAGLLEGRTLELVVGAGAYIAGEETAMLESMEGRRAMPRLRPPFPAQFGYLGRPTLINNVETLAHIPAILRNGGAWWAGLGRRDAPGTRLWSVSGAVAKPGCYEAPSGITTRELVDEFAGGFVGEVGAVVPGGAASGILPPAAFDTPLTRDALREWARGRRLGGGAGLPGLVLPAPPARRDDAVLRRGVVPEVHAVPDRQPCAPPPLRRARARPRGDDAGEARRVAPRNGEDVDLRSRPGLSHPGAERDAPLAGAVRATRARGGCTVTAVVEFTLDGRTVSAPEGELLVHAAARHGTFIPTLCHDSKLDPYGGCRMCVVDVEGAPRPMPACATRVAEGIVVSTNGQITDFQKTLTEMLLSEHLNPSPGGRPNELRDLADELGAEAPLVLPDAKREEYDDRNRLMGYDPDACILCNRCVRYTQEVMQCSALSLEGRGGHSRIVPTWGLSWLDTECELCGGCLSVCPTGAIYEKFEEGTTTARAAARAGADDLHVLRRRLPGRPQPRSRDEAHRQGDVEGRVPAERGQPLRQGPLRVQLRPPPGPADPAARPR